MAREQSSLLKGKSLWRPLDIKKNGSREDLLLIKTKRRVAVKDTGVKIGGLYEHYKGKRYRVHGLARHSETLEQVVYYECLYENDLGVMWVRPLDLFIESVTIDGVTVPRFKEVSEE